MREEGTGGPTKDRRSSRNLAVANGSASTAQFLSGVAFRNGSGRELGRQIGARYDG